MLPDNTVSPSCRNTSERTVPGSSRNTSGSTPSPAITPGCRTTIRTAAESGAALVALGMRDTVKRSTDGKHACETLDRSLLWSAQTPQVFERTRFLELLRIAEQERWTPTDDSALWERLVGPVTLVAGSATNWKITTPEDLLLAEALLRSRGSRA